MGSRSPSGALMAAHLKPGCTNLPEANSGFRPKAAAGARAAIARGRVTYTSRPRVDFDVAVQTLDGVPEVVFDTGRDEVPIGWLPDGRMLISWSI